MKLHKSTMCALYAVLELAAHPELQISAGEIADKYGISLNHLAKVLRSLVRARLIESVRGPGGGYRLSGNPKRVTLLDIIELFEDPAPDLDEATTADSEESRALHKVLKDLAAKGDAITEAELGVKMSELMAEAVAQIQAAK